MDVALFTQEGLIMILRWIHFFAGVAWIGHLYYFNFVQGAFLAEVDAPVKNATLAKLAPKALWWFRWGAMGTFLSGVAMLAIVGKELAGDFFQTPYGIFIFTGGLLGTIMFLNVWLIIWPNQKIVIASAKQVAAGGQADPAAAAAAGKAGLASRHNTLFSLPMLFFMGAASHLPAQVNPEYNGKILALVIILIVGLLELNGIKGKTDTVKITSIKGVVHMGIFLTVILYVAIELLTK